MNIVSNYHTGEIAFLKQTETSALFSYIGSKPFPKGFKLIVEGDTWIVTHTAPSDYVPTINNVYLIKKDI